MRLVRSAAAGEQARRLSREVHYPHEGLNPRGQVAKGMEMAVRRGAMFARLCTLYSERVGATEAERTPPHRSFPAEEKLAQDIFGKYWYNDRLLGFQWSWAYRLWLVGSLERSMQDMLAMLPPENRARAESEIAK